MTPDLRTRYLGLELRSPLVASASPLTGVIDNLRALDAAGAGAVVLPSLFEEQLTADALAVDRVLATADCFPEALGGHVPGLEGYNTGPERYLSLVERAKAAVSIPVVASLNGTSRGGWARYATLLQDAGADALELNLYAVASDPDEDGAAVERRYLQLVASVRELLRVPLAVKLSPYFSALTAVARALVDAGADGLVLFNRFYQPDIDLESLDVVPRLTLSSPDELRLPLRWIAILHGRVDASLAATTGIHSAADAAKALLAGADVAMMTSALLRHGPAHLGRVRDDLVAWMAEREYDSVEQLKGSLSQGLVPDPGAYERAGYVRTLTSFAYGR